MSKIWLHTQEITSSSKTQFQIKLPKNVKRLTGILLSAMDESKALDNQFQLYRGSLWLRDSSCLDTFYSSEFKYSLKSYEVESPHFNGFKPYLPFGNPIVYKGFLDDFTTLDTELESNIINGYYESDVLIKSSILLRIYLKTEV